MTIPREAKQVILVRTDLGMRKGKMIAQGAHASLKVFLDRADEYKDEYTMVLWDAALTWIRGSFTKIVLAVNSEQQLLDFHVFALRAGLHTALIRDAGRTEFKGVPTLTALAIGPDWVDDIDALTSKLRLL